jgi:hypothetical protein
MTPAFGLVVALSLTLVQPPSLASVLAHAGDSAITLYREFRELVADESYVQDFDGGQLLGRMIRSLRSEFAMVADEAHATWYGFRNVFEVNGRALPGDVRGRLERALRGPPAARLGEAWRISEEGAQYLLTGTSPIPIAPNFALMVLLPTQQPRFVFSKQGEERVGDATVWVIACREIRGPMFFQAVDGSQVPMAGEFWIEPDSGTVLRSHFVVDSADAVRVAGDRPNSVNAPRREAQGLLSGTGERKATFSFSRMSVDVTYGHDPTTGVFAPRKMTEICSREAKRGGGEITLDGLAASHYVSERLSCMATYTNVRRVRVPEAGVAEPRR